MEAAAEPEPLPEADVELASILESVLALAAQVEAYARRHSLRALRQADIQEPLLRICRIIGLRARRLGC